MPGFAPYQPRSSQPPAQVTLRPAAADDVDAMEGVQRRAGRLAHPDAYRRAIHDPDRCVLVAECSSQTGEPIVVGWAQTYHHARMIDLAPPGYYLGGITVDPSWRRRGIALALTGARMRWIAQRADEAFYVVNPGNLASIELHRRWAFEEVLRAPRLTGMAFTGGVGILLRAPSSESPVPRSPAR